MAFLGFTGTVFALQNARRGAIVYEKLAQGFPAEAARMALYLILETECEVGLYEGLLRASDVELYGDDYTGLKGVYVQNMTASTAWSRPQ